MRERRLIRRVARYADHWRKIATKRSVWRMCHEGYSGEAKHERAGTPTRSKPRCDPDLLRLSLSSLDGKTMAQTVSDLSVEAAADLVASFATPTSKRAPSADATIQMTAATQRRLPLAQQRGVRTPLTKTSEFISSLKTVQEELSALGQQYTWNTKTVSTVNAPATPVNLHPYEKAEKSQAVDLLAHIRELRRAVEGSLASP